MWKSEILSNCEGKTETNCKSDSGICVCGIHMQKNVVKDANYVKTPETLNDYSLSCSCRI